MKAAKKAKTATLNLRVSPEFKERLAEEATKARRSVTNYVEVTLMDLWEAAEKPNAGKKRS
jgi:predicted HicB family RNase H-like nuclease